MARGGQRGRSAEADVRCPERSKLVRDVYKKQGGTRAESRKEHDVTIEAGPSSVGRDWSFRFSGMVRKNVPVGHNFHPECDTRATLG